MNEEKGNTNMTVGVVLTVAVAILLLVAMIPAMMPAQEGGEAHTYHYALVEGDTAEYTLKYAYMDEDGNVTSTLAGTTTAEGIVPDVTLHDDTHFRFESGYLEFRESAMPQIMPLYFGQPDGFYNNGTKLADDRVVPYLQAAYSWTIPDSDALMDCFTCPNVVLPGQTFDPSSAVPDPSEGGDAPVDTNTVLIGAIISLMFISIALVAVRSFRA